MAFQRGAFQSPGYQQPATTGTTHSGRSQANIFIDYFSYLRRGTGAQTGQTPAGRSRKRERWEVEYDGVIRSFSTAQEASDWLLSQAKAQVKEEKKTRPTVKQIVQTARKEKPKVYYEGVEVTYVDVGDSEVFDYLLSRTKARLLDQAMLSRLRDIDGDDDDDDVLLLMG